MFCFLLGKPISGPELSMLLEILVTAANEGSLAEVFTVLCVNFGKHFLQR